MKNFWNRDVRRSSVKNSNNSQLNWSEVCSCIFVLALRIFVRQISLSLFRLLNHKSIKMPFMYLCRVSNGMQFNAMAISTVCNSLNAISCMFFFHFARFLFVFATQSSFLSWQNEKKSVRWQYSLLVRHNHEATISIRFDTWNEIFYPSKLFFSTVSRQLSISFSCFQHIMIHHFRLSHCHITCLSLHMVHTWSALTLHLGWTFFHLSFYLDFFLNNTFPCTQRNST